MSAGRIVLLIFGILFVLVSFGLLGGGGVVLAVDRTFKDSQGFYTTGNIPVNSNSSVIVTQPANIHIDGTWFDRRNDLAVVRVEAINRNETRPIFIGIARQIDINSYLSGVAYDEVRDFSFDTFDSSSVSYNHHSGSKAVAPPAEQDFWIASADGTGAQTLQWNVTSGRYAIVMMNADGTGPVAADVALAVKIPEIVYGVGLGLLIGGIVLLIIGGVMIFFAIRGW